MKERIMRFSGENSVKGQTISSIPFPGENGMEGCIMRLRRKQHIRFEMIQYSEENSIKHKRCAVEPHEDQW